MCTENLNPDIMVMKAAKCADVKRFFRLINADKIFGTHRTCRTGSSETKNSERLRRLLRSARAAQSVTGERCNS